MTWDWDKLQEKKERQSKNPNEFNNQSNDDSSGFNWLGDIFSKLQKQWFSAFFIVILVLLLLWGLTGFYKVQPNYVGVVLRLGQFRGELNKTGFYYHLPYPIERVLFLNVKEKITTRETETLYPTKDGQLFGVKAFAEYQISEPQKYLFNATDHVQRLNSITNSSVLDFVRSNNLETLLSMPKSKIEESLISLLNSRLHNHDSGLTVASVNVSWFGAPRELDGIQQEIKNIQKYNQLVLEKTHKEVVANIADANKNAEIILNRAEINQLLVRRQFDADMNKVKILLPAYIKNKQQLSWRLFMESMDSIFNKQDNHIKPSLTPNDVNSNKDELTNALSLTERLKKP